MYHPKKGERLYLQFISGQVPNLLQLVTSVTILNYLQRNPYLSIFFAIAIPLAMVAYLNTAFNAYLMQADPEEIKRKHYVYHLVTVSVLALVIITISLSLLASRAPGV